MTTDVLHVEFNGRREPLNSVLAEIKPDLYTMKEALEMVTSTITAYDEADCQGPVSVCDSGPQTIPDGRISGDKIGVRLSGRGMNNELNRLESFKDHHWPGDSPVSASNLARAGFYYSGFRDAVKCFSCGGQVEGWEYGDTAMGEHQRLFPRCDFANNRTTTNVALLETKESLEFARKLSSKIEQSQREIGRRASRSYWSPSPTPDQLRAGRMLLQQKNLTAQMGPLNNCKHPDYVQESARLLTFRRWPGNPGINVTPKILAKAGFYFTGLADECKCFYCDGGLKNWEPTDEPWTEHAKWFPRCEWLIQQREHSFISHVQQVNPPPIRSPPLHFTSPTFGTEEPYSQVEPPHSFQATYLERHPQATSKSSPPLNRSKKEMTIEEEKAAAHQEFNAGHRSEPKAAAIVNFRPKPKKLEVAEPSALKSKLGEEQSSATSSIDDFLRSDMAQMAVEMGYHHDLIRYVVTQRFRKTDRQFSTPDELLESIWEAQGQGIDPTLSVGKAMGGQDAEYLKKPPKAMDSESASAMSSSFLGFQTENVAGRSIQDQLRKKMNPPSSTVPQIREGYGEGYLTPTVSQNYQVGEEEDDREEDIRQTIAFSEDLQSDMSQMTDEMGFALQRCKKTDQLLSTTSELTESILDVQGQSNNPTPSGLQAVGSQDVPSTSAMSSSIEDTSVHQAENVAGRSIQDEPSKKMNPPSSTVHQIREGYGEGYLTPTVSQNYQVGEEEDDREEDIRQTIAFSEDLQSNMSQMTDEMGFHLKRRKKTDQLLSTNSELTEGQFHAISSGSSDPYKQLCKICLDNEFSTVFLPCKHLVTCSDCAAKFTECPLCRERINDSLTVSMS